MKTNKRVSFTQRQSRTGFIFVSPWILGFAAFVAVPLIQSLIYSFCSMEISESGIGLQWVGLENFQTAFLKDPNYNKHLVSSITGMLYQIPVIMIFSLFIAIIMNQKFRGRVFARAIFFIPVIISTGVVLTVMNNAPAVAQIMNSSTESTLMQFTEFKGMLGAIGIGQQIIDGVFGFVNDIFSIVLKSGIQILLFLAGLQTIPVSNYEAATIEGANAWEMFWKISFPLISPIILLNLVYTVIDNLTAYTNSAMSYINILSSKMEYVLSSAMSWCYFLIILAVIGIVFLLVGKRIVYLNN